MPVALFYHREEDFISLAVIARHRDTEQGDCIIQNWMCNSNTIEFDGIKKQPKFKSFLINIECLVTEARTQNTDRIENS